ncbi:formin-mediated actin nucleation enhancer [Sporobolomyces koalae]|uniref:formin-mediated actin nucleation enhancer n=1 Tax=Sporobolomyces koalae TaxID=500713 RepID=UPI00316E63D5
MSSTTAASGTRPSGTRTRTGGASTSNLESTITRLLVCTKSLLEGLAKWSRGEVNEEEISAIYVKLGNDFNVACAVFARENISMNELLSVPSDLRVCLETCLSDTPSQATLERHLPQVRQIIIGLLHGLREKQRLYRDGVAARRAKEATDRTSDSLTGSTAAANLTGPISTGQPLTPTSAGRSKEDLRRFVNQAQQAVPAATAAVTAPPDAARPRHVGERRVASEDASSTVPRPPSNIGSTRSLGSRGGSLRDSSRSSRATLDSTDGVFVTAPPTGPSPPPLASLPPLPRTASDASITSVAGSSRSTAQADTERISHRRRSPPPPPPDNEPIPRTPTLEQFPSPFSLQQASVLASRPIPTIMARPPSVADQQPNAEPQQQVTVASLEALKASDNLSRRASKRYSAYAIQKMTSPSGGNGSSPGEGPLSSPISRASSSRSRTDLARVAELNGDSTRRRADKVEHRPHRSIGGGSNGPLPPLPAIPRSFSSQAELSSRGTHSPIREEDELGTSPAASPALSTATATGPPSFPPPPLPRTASTSSIPPSESSFITRNPPAQTDSIISTSSTVTSRAQSPSFPCSIFLQIGRDVKKARLTEPPTIQSLRQVFVERFQYNPGISGWPEIYLRDPEAGVSYELEDMDEVLPGSVLSLNIDTVEQVKQHIDQGMTSLAQDIKELRSHVFSMRRLSVSAASLSNPGGNNNPALLSPEPPVGASPSLRPSPSEAQFRDAAQRVLRMKRLGSVTSLAPDEIDKTGTHDKSAEQEEDEKESAVATPTTPSTPTQSTTEVVSTLKSQHAEVQNLRREIGVLRQVYVDFTSQTKEMFSAARIQNSRVHHLASTKLSSDRAFVEAGTAKLESDSTNLVVKVDELQDTVEQLREDTVKGVRPRPQQLNEMATQLRKATDTREHLVKWLKEVKPSWSQKWSEELSKILGEQKAVETQETLLNELSDDLDDVAGVFTKIQAVAKTLKPGTPSTGTLTSPIGPGVLLNAGGARTLRDFGGGDSQEGLSTVLLEVKALQPDPAKRLEAIAKAERQRELALQNKTDEFADELGEFVGMGKLKKSGGIEETERLRQAKSEATLKAMFSG